jgi:hypothetical protein
MLKVTLATITEQWAAVVRKDKNSYGIRKIRPDCFLELNPNLLVDAVIIFGKTKQAVEANVRLEYPGYVRFKASIDCIT